jgi:transposase InsO family protein
MIVYHPTRRFEMVAIDFMEISPKPNRGNTKIVVIGDTFSRYAWAFPFLDEKLGKIAKVLLDGWILRYGPPEKLLSVRGKVFIARILLGICEFMGVKKIFKTSYHPQCDGFVERMNRTLGKIWLHSLPRKRTGINMSLWHVSGTTPAYTRQHVSRLSRQCMV